MKRVSLFISALLSLGFAGTVFAATFEFHGDLNNRFNLYTNQAGMYSGAETISVDPDKKAVKVNDDGTVTPATNGPLRPGQVIDEDGRSEMWGDIKYRLWAEAATNDGKVKGVYAIEIGAIRFGDSSKGGAYSGDGVNIETRWAYADLQLPTENKNRLMIGLIPFSVNKYLWSETAMGIQLKGESGPVAYTAAWMRGNESFNNGGDDDTFEDADNLLLRGDFKQAEGLKTGAFVLYQRKDNVDDAIKAADVKTSYLLKKFGNAEYGIYTLGLDGGFTAPTDFGNIFVNADLMYQGGSIDEPGDQDVSAYFVHADVGANIGRFRLTYTGWYASGDDDPADGDWNNFTATDVDTFDSVVLFEGGYTDDNYFTEAPYFLTYGAILNRVAADYKVSDKLAFGGALLYVMTAEDLPNGENTLGTEIDGYVSYKLYPNVELAINAGYLFADEGMAYFTAGPQEEDVFRSTARVRYTF